MTAVDILNVLNVIRKEVAAMRLSLSSLYQLKFFVTVTVIYRG